MKTNYLLTVLALFIGLQITNAQSINNRSQVDGLNNPKNPPVDIDNITLSASNFYYWEIVSHTGTQSDFVAVQFTDDYHGWVIGADGIMIYTTNAGSSWEEYNFGPSVHLNAVYFIDNETGFVAGSVDVGPQTKGIAYKTTDGGSTWYVSYLSESQMIINSITFAPFQDGFLAATLLHPYRSQAVILKTSDMGDRWRLIELNSNLVGIDHIFFKSHAPSREIATGWAIGRINLWVRESQNDEYTDITVILKSTDGGDNWNINSYMQPGLNLTDLSFSDAENGIAVGNNGTVLITHDEGEDWIAQHINQYDFNGTICGNDHNMWIISDEGMILSTRNGGENWVQDDTPLNNDLNAICSTPHGHLWVAGDEGTLYRQVFFPIDKKSDGENQNLNDNSVKSSIVQDNGSDLNDEGELWSIVSHKNYPNPFSDKTTISFELDKPVHVQIYVFNINGKLVKTLADQFEEAGHHEVVFNANNISPGIYTYVLRAGNQVEKGKMIINR